MAEHEAIKLFESLRVRQYLLGSAQKETYRRRSE